MTSKRRVGITKFKGTHMVNIREYYEKDGEALPGKKVGSLFHLFYLGWYHGFCFRA